MSPGPRDNPRRRLRRLVLALAVACGFAGWAGPASALTPASLVTPDLERTEVLLSGLSNGEADYFDRDRRLVSRSTDELVAIHLHAAPQGPTQPRYDAAPAVDVLTLNDGQRLVGTWLGGADGGESARFKHPRLGVVTVPLDQLRAVGAGAAHAVPRVVRDTVTLLNGDTLEGFVLAVRHDAIELSPADGGAALTLPRDQVRSLVLANPDEPPGTQHHRLSLRDGSEIAVRRLSLDGDTARFHPALLPGRSVALALDQLQRIAFTGYGRRLAPLDLPRLETQAGGRVFGVPAPPRPDRGDLLLHAPVTVTTPLAPDATRLTTQARLELPDGVDPAVRKLASLRLGVTLSHAPTHWFVLDAERPVASINLPLPEASSSDRTPPLAGDRNALRSVTWEVDPHRNGPILDRLRLVAPRVLIERPSAAAWTDDPDL